MVIVDVWQVTYIMFGISTLDCLWGKNFAFLLLRKAQWWDKGTNSRGQGQDI